MKIKYSFINILSSSDLSKRRLPLMMVKSDNPGPVVWLTGCMHGDEIGGTVVIHQIFKKLKVSLLKGTVFGIPLMNPSGFENVTRNISISKEDLNRSFPGNKNGTFAERIANIIFNLIIETKPDLVLDLHNDWNKSIPYILIDSIQTDKILNEKNINFAKKSGLVIINDTDKIITTLTYNLLLNYIPALTLELGESLIINEKNVENGVRSLWNMLFELGMVKCENIFHFPVVEIINNKILNYYSKPLSSNSGIIHFSKRPGDMVYKGQKIAKIYNAFGKIIQTLEAHHNGIILGHSDYAVTYPGAPVMAFGILD